MTPVNNSLVMGGWVGVGDTVDVGTGVGGSVLLGSGVFALGLVGIDVLLGTCCVSEVETVSPCKGSVAVVTGCIPHPLRIVTVRRVNAVRQDFIGDGPLRSRWSRNVAH